MFYQSRKKREVFSIRKYSFGAASVLLGAILIGGVAQQVSADEVTGTNTEQVAKVTTETAPSAPAEELSPEEVTTDSEPAAEAPTLADSETTTNDVTSENEVPTSSDASENVETPSQTENLPSVTDDSISLDKTTIGHDGTNKGIVATVSYVGNSGDTFTVTIPKSAIYRRPTVAALSSAVGETTLREVGDNYVITNTFIATATISQKITIAGVSNYVGQASPIADIGEKDLVMTLAGTDANGNSLGEGKQTYKAIINPTMRPSFTRVSPPTSVAKVIMPHTDYTYRLDINNANGVQDDGYTSGRINSAVNYGSVITVPVPEGFILNSDATLTQNNFNDKTSIEQPDGVGTPIIITVPKGSGSQNWQAHPGYYLVGQYDIEEPQVDTIVTGDAPITVVENLNEDGTKQLTGTAGPWSDTIRGVDSVESVGNWGVSASGADRSNLLLLDHDSSNDPKYVNFFGFSNDSSLNLSDATITLDIADGLEATSITVPRSTQTKMRDTKSWDYEFIYADGSSSTGTVAAGETAKAVGNSPIRKAIFQPNMIASGDATDNASPSQNEAAVLFYVGGKLSETYDDGRSVKSGDRLVSAITVTSPSLKTVEPDGTVNFIFTTAKNGQVVQDEGDTKASLATYHYQPEQAKVPGMENGGYVALMGTSYSDLSTRIYEPVFYYVLPKDVVYSGNIRYVQGEPAVSTFWSGDQQIVKVDYTGTNAYVNTKSGAFNNVYLTNLPTARVGSYPIEVYVYTTSGFSNQLATAVPTYKSDFTEGRTDKVYHAGRENWQIRQAEALYLAGISKGNLNSGYVGSGTSDDKGSTEMSYALTITNGLSVDTRNVRSYINIPRVENGDDFDFTLTGPVTMEHEADVVVTYATDFASLSMKDDAGVSEQYVSADKISDWSAVKSIRIEIPLLSASSSTDLFYLNGEDKTLAADSGKTGYITSVMLANRLNPLVTERGKGAPRITVQGSSTIHTQLEYVDENGQTITLPLEYENIYTDNQDIVSPSDFPSDVDGFGEDDQAILNDLLTKGYEIDKDNFPSTTIVNAADSDKTWQTDQENKTAVFGEVANYYVDGDSVVYKLVHGMTETDENQVITRIINVHKPDGSVETIRQEVTVTRKVTTDKVTGEKTYSNWTTGDWDAYTTPTVPGYTPSQSSVDLVSVTGGDEDVVVDITYTPNPQKLLVNFIDDTANTTLKTDVTIGDSETQADLTVANQSLADYLATGYKLVVATSDVTENASETAGEVSPTIYDTDDVNDQVLTIHLIHDMTESEENQVITRIINVHKPDGSVETTRQQVTVTRKVTTDKVTGEKTYSNWTTDDWDAYTTPTVPGYTPSQSSVDLVSVTGGDEDVVVDITYMPNLQKLFVDFIDDTTATLLKTDSLTGASETPVDLTTPNKTLADYLAQGYELVVSGSDVESGATGDSGELTAMDYDADDTEHQVLTIHLVHGTVADTESKTITRIINVHKPDGTVESIHQPVTVTRPVTIDKVTGEKTYGDWTIGDWSSYETPTFVGYTPSRSLVDLVTVSGDDEDVVVDIFYTTNPTPAKAAVSTLSSHTQSTQESPNLKSDMKKATELPETGDKGEQASLVGLVIMTLLGLHFLPRRKKD